MQGDQKPSGKFSNFERVSILSEALPYLQKFQNKVIVVKYGGAAMKDPTLKVSLLSNILTWRAEQVLLCYMTKLRDG